jgi:hypothetical protein
MIGSPVPGKLAELTGSYAAAYMLFAVFFSLTIIAIFVMYHKLERINTQKNIQPNAVK